MRLRCYFIAVLMLAFSVVGKAQTNNEDLLQDFQETIDSIKDAEEVSVEEVGEFYEEVYDEDYTDDEYDEDEEYEEYAPIDYYDQRRVDQKKWSKYKKDKRFIYKIKPKKKKKEKKPWSPNLSFLNGALFKFFLYLVVAGVLGYIVFLFFKNNEFSFKRKGKSNTENEEMPWEEVESFEDWELALQKAEQDKDYRLATRILYLQSLQKLNNQSLIDYSQEKTNWHYVQKLFGTTYHEPFKTLTTYFDYIWYGNYHVEEERYNEVKSSFLTFNNTVYA